MATSVTPQGQRQVAQILRPATNWIAAEMPIANAVEAARRGEFRTFLVGDGRRLIGVINQKQIDQSVPKEGTETCAGDIIGSLGHADFPHVHPDHALYVALERMGAYELHLLPVVSRADIHIPLGIVTIEDVLASFGLPHIPD